MYTIMKKIITIMAIIIASISILRAQSYYLCQGKKVNLKIDSTMYAVQTNINNYDKQLLVLDIKQQNGEIKFFQKIMDDLYLVEGEIPISGEYNYFSNVYLNNDNKIVIIVPRIIVMFKDDKASQLVLDNYKNTLIKDKGSKQKYVFNLIVSSSKEVLELVSEIDSREDVIWCEPVFYSEYSLNNTLYTQQYYLNNTGQNGGTAGIDINVEPAWSITNGSSSVTVAVIDDGVERNHEDIGNRVLEGLTLYNPTGLGEPQNANELYTKYHGTACAGIIAASNNLIGIRGIASNVNILPVNIAPVAPSLYNGVVVLGFGYSEDVADAIN